MAVRPEGDDDQPDGDDWTNVVVATSGLRIWGADHELCL
jgi:hypothetical protein